MATIKLLNDGSSLAGWTSAGAVVNSSNGNPAPSILVPDGKYCYIDAGMLFNDVMSFDVKLGGGSSPLTAIMFFCDASGNGGTYLRLEGRSMLPCYFSDSASGWNGNPTGNIRNAVNNGGLTSTGFVNVVIYTRIYNGVSMAKVTINGVLFIDWVQVNRVGSYIGLSSTATGGGAYFDNIKVYTSSTLSGVALLDNGKSADYVLIRDWDTYQHIAKIIPAADGTWTTVLYPTNYEVTVVGPAGYQPICHGPIQSV